MKRTLPPETFYSGLSLNYDLGYGVEGEYNIVRNILETEGLPTDDASVVRALDLCKAAYTFLGTHCQEEIQAYDHKSKEEMIVGCDIAGVVGLAHLLLGIALTTIKLKKTFSEASKTSQEEKLLDSIVKKLETTKEGSIVVKKTTEYEITLAKKPKKPRSTKSQKRKRKTTSSHLINTS